VVALSGDDVAGEDPRVVRKEGEAPLVIEVEVENGYIVFGAQVPLVRYGAPLTSVEGAPVVRCFIPIAKIARD
jgi:hypothetical protein